MLLVKNNIFSMLAFHIDFNEIQAERLRINSFIKATVNIILDSQPLFILLNYQESIYNITSIQRYLQNGTRHSEENYNQFIF